MGDKPILVWIIEGNAFLCLQFPGGMRFPIVKVMKDIRTTSIDFLTLETWLLADDVVKIDTKQVFLDLDIDDRILDRLKGCGFTIPSISTTNFLKG